MISPKSSSISLAVALRRLAIAGLLISGCSSSLRGQISPTDAGRILRDEQNRNRSVAPPARKSIPVKAQEPAGAKDASGGPKVRINAVRFVGNTAIGAEQLLASLELSPERDLDLGQLRALAERVTQVYRQAGYPFAQAVLPKQEIKEGVVVIEVIEGRYGAVIVTGEDRLAGSLKGYLSGLKPGSLIEENELQHDLLVMSELPGVTFSPVFSPGASAGTADLKVLAARDEAWHGSIRTDNYGVRFSGAYRLQLEATRAGLLEIGDKLGANLLVTDERLLLGGARYELPLSFAGLRASAGYARTDYQLGAGYQGFTGLADTWSAGLTYPLMRSRQTNLTLTLGAEHKHLEDKFLGTTYERRELTVASVGLQFDRRDVAWGGGLSYGELKFYGGNVSSDVAGSPQGGFTKANLSISRLQNASEGFTLFGSLCGQVSDRTLNAAESFSLGGATGVRAFPNGEAQSSRGLLGQVELRYAVGSLSPYLFYDQGRISAQSSQPARTLGGVGLGLRYQAGSLSADAACAWKTNGGEALSDSRPRDPRVWVSVGYRY
jgi:hemolysin activation/secretion protein